MRLDVLNSLTSACNPSMSSFWKTQPVDRGSADGIIETSRNVSTERVPLPDGFSWIETADIQAISTFLAESYVEDSSSSYRLTYLPPFFEFMFEYPLHKKEYSLSLCYNGTMVGYVLAREHSLFLREKTYRIISVNFLCLSREHRSKNLAPLIIKEITRIANSNGIFQAIFTAEKDHGFSVLSARYYHYPLDGDILIRAGIIDKREDAMPVPVCRADTKIVTDCESIMEIYKKMSEQYCIHEVFTPGTFQQTFEGKKGVLQTVHNHVTGDFASFYTITTNCIGRNIQIKRSYLYYWYGSVEIVNDAIAVAKSQDTHMFDILDIADNKRLIEKLPLLEGTGVLRYHFFNIKECTIQKEICNFILF